MSKTLHQQLKSFERDLSHRFGKDISTPAARRRAYLHFHLLDHGLIRSFWTNLHQISPGVWRSNQPSARRLRAFKRMGITTVLNLRGNSDMSPYLFEKETCDAIGLNLVSVRLSAHSLMSRERLLALLDQFETLKRPFVMHCKSGADRAGLAAALFLLHIENSPIMLAKKQLSFKFIHVRFSQTGILDHMLRAYESDTKASPMPIRTWIETNYDAAALIAEFDAKRGRT